MSQILIPTRSLEDWKHLLARPDRHWKPDYSAMALAQRWEAGNTRGFPAEVARVLATAGRDDWKDLRVLLAIPEYKVPLPGGKRASQTDLFVLARAKEGLVTIAVEGKVNESFGPTVGRKRAAKSPGVAKRIKYLELQLGLPTPCPATLRYQLLHRTYAALHLAKQFTAKVSVMLVHSFSATDKGYSDYQEFASSMGASARSNGLSDVGTRNGTRLYIGWVQGRSENAV